MMPASSPEPVLTLEPLLDAVRDGLTDAGWSLSGLQKTTSYEFEGRWAGEASRSAYLFFHREGLPDWVSIDVFLDETARGLKGNLALVVDGPTLARLGDSQQALARLAAAARRRLPGGYRTPLTLRCRVERLEDDPAEASTEFRFKLYVPAKALQAGQGAVSSLAVSCAAAFEALLESEELKPLLALSGEED